MKIKRTTYSMNKMKEMFRKNPSEFIESLGLKDIRDGDTDNVLFAKDQNGGLVSVVFAPRTSSARAVMDLLMHSYFYHLTTEPHRRPSPSYSILIAGQIQIKHRKLIGRLNDTLDCSLQAGLFGVELRPRTANCGEIFETRNKLTNLPKKEVERRVRKMEKIEWKFLETIKPPYFKPWGICVDYGVNEKDSRKNFKRLTRLGFV